MTHARLAIAAVALALAVALVAVASRGGTDAGEGERVLGPGESVVLTTSISPAAQVFGEPFTAELDVILDARRIEPDSVGLVGNFSPLEQIGRTAVTRTRQGDAVRIRFRFELACFTVRCLPTGNKGPVDIAPTDVFLTVRDRDRRTRETALWPSVDIVSRLATGDVEDADWRSPATLPAVTYRVEPIVLAVVLAGTALAFAAAGLLLLWRLFPQPRRTGMDAAQTREPTRLERALLLVDEHSRNGATPGQREALERLARELSAAGHGELAADARRLAWSAHGASRAEVDELLAAARHAGAER